MDTRHCIGCEDDFYNGNNPLGVERCWSLKTAKLVTRFAIGTWTLPDSPGAFTKTIIPHCYHAKGQHFCKELPEFVRTNDVIDATGET